MKKIFLLVVLVQALCLMVPAQEESKCYRLMGLKDEDEITLKIDGAKVTGDYSVRREYDENNVEHYPFTGTMAGNVLTVKFDGKKPDSLPAAPTSYSWAILTAPTSDKLRVQFYGKNHETNKYSNYFTEFESCEPVYGFLAKSPQVVKFDPGQNSATMQVTFPDNKGYRTFLIGVVKGQKLEISAPGCIMRVYLPDKNIFLYWENPGQADSGKASVALDAFAMHLLPQSGNYLIALQAVGDLSPRKVSFRITN